MKRFLLFLSLLFPISLFAQIGGSAVYEFVSLPYSARENISGGTIITSQTTHLATALRNPSILDSTYSNVMIGSWGLLHLKKSGIGCGTIGYAHSIRPNITLDAGIHFIDYGRFEGYDEYGNKIENFVPIEYELIFGGSYRIKQNLSLGANIKPILSYLESYSSYGILFDLAATYKWENSCVSLATRNVGWQLKTYTEGNRENIPYSIDLGFSHTLSHAPFRFNITYTDIQKFDLSYDDEIAAKNTLLNGEEEEEREFVSIGKNFIKHITLSGELLLGKHIVAMLGYNYRKSEELSFGDTKKATGLGIGFELNFSRFNLSYGWSKQHAAGGKNYITLSFNTMEIYSICKTGFQKNKNTEQ